MTPRTDLHSPSNFNPGEYVYLGAVYVGNASSDEAWDYISFYLEENDVDMDKLLELAKNSSYDGNYKQKGSCDHCGAWFAYGAVYRHMNGDVIVVGHQCAGNAFGHNSREEYDMAKLHKKIDAARKYAAGKKAAVLFLSSHGLPADFFAPKHYIIQDIESKLIKYGSISDNQITLVKKIVLQVAEAETRKTEESQEPKSPVVEGRIAIEGIVCGLKTVDTEFGTTFKMLVKDNRHFKVWGTVPSAIDPKRGDRVKFVATVERSKDDESFGFFKRPSKSELITVA